MGRDRSIPRDRMWWIVEEIPLIRACQRGRVTRKVGPGKRHRFIAEPNGAPTEVFDQYGKARDYVFENGEIPG